MFTVFPTSSCLSPLALLGSQNDPVDPPPSLRAPRVKRLSFSSIYYCYFYPFSYYFVDRIFHIFNTFYRLCFSVFPQGETLDTRVITGFYLYTTILFYIDFFVECIELRVLTFRPVVENNRTREILTSCIS
jgi:hypothetical protein